MPEKELDKTVMDDLLSSKLDKLSTDLSSTDSTMSKLLDTKTFKSTADKESETGLGEGFEDLAVTKAQASFRNIKAEEHDARNASWGRVGQYMNQQERLFAQRLKHEDSLFYEYMNNRSEALSDERKIKYMSGVQGFRHADDAIYRNMAEATEIEKVRALYNMKAS